jgi:hypothetical protein
MVENKNLFDVRTRIYGNNIIECEIFDDTKKSIEKLVIDLREKHVTESLIKLGWTPPTNKT